MDAELIVLGSVSGTSTDGLDMLTGSGCNANACDHAADYFTPFEDVSAGDPAALDAE